VLGSTIKVYLTRFTWLAV